MTSDQYQWGHYSDGYTPLVRCVAGPDAAETLIVERFGKEWGGDEDLLVEYVRESELSGDALDDWYSDNECDANAYPGLRVFGMDDFVVLAQEFFGVVSLIDRRDTRAARTRH